MCGRMDKTIDVYDYERAQMLGTGRLVRRSEDEIYLEGFRVKRVDVLDWKWVGLEVIYCGDSGVPTMRVRVVYSDLYGKKRALIQRLYDMIRKLPWLRPR